GLGERAKIIGQLLVIGLLVPVALWGSSRAGRPLTSSHITFVGDVSWLDLARWGPVVAVLLTLIWYGLLFVGTTNGVNITDGADAMLTGCAIFSLSAYALIMLFQVQNSCTTPGGGGAGCFDTVHPLDLAVVTCALLGNLIGYLWWACHPAQIFMGDTGSLGIGGFLVALAILSRTELLLPFIGLVYVMVTASVLIQRYYFKLTGGKRFFKMAPLHHHFELKGWSESTITIRFWLINAVGALTAVLLFYAVWLARTGLGTQSHPGDNGLMPHGFGEPGPEALCAEEESLARLLADDTPEVEPTPYGSEVDQVFETYGPANGPLVVVVHGGYFRSTIDRTHARPMARALATSGLRVVLTEYRRVPGRPELTMDDLRLLEDHLTAHGDRPALWLGHSAGGLLVLQRATDRTRPPVPVIALAGVTGLIRAAAEGVGDGAIVGWMGGSPADLPGAYDQADPQVRLSRPYDHDQDHPTPKIWLLHGTDDVTVPVSHSVTFGAPATIIHGAHHYDLIDPESPYWPRVVSSVLEAISRA
ncbi:MAG: hypothetical protein L0G99_11115, partial [Propionibacteriales bacterium]|nr:hypothetical protein [Propionibacteriales bacterium]